MSFDTFYNTARFYYLLLKVLTGKKIGLKLLDRANDMVNDSAIVCSFHFGPWEPAARLLARQYLYYSVAGKRDFLNFLREISGVRLIFSNRGVFDIIRQSKNRALVIMLDRPFFEKGVFVEFGNKKLKISRLPFYLSDRLNKNIYLTASYWNGTEVVLKVLKVLHPRDGSIGERAKKTAELYYELLRAYPFQWTNFFAEWR